MESKFTRAFWRLPSKEMEKTDNTAHLQKLFIEGTDSDVTIIAVNKEFALHKLYLCKSPYFAAMFGGNWKETNETRIVMDVVDPEITAEDFTIVLKSLYTDEVELEPSNVVGVLAGATMLHLDNLCKSCCEFMLKMISASLAGYFYEVAYQYGQMEFKNCCVDWFLPNLTVSFQPNLKDLKTIPSQLMKTVIGHCNLWVLWNEQDLYEILCQWMFLKIHQEKEDVTAEDVSLFYSSRTGQTPFLLTTEGGEFIEIFKLLKIQYLIENKELLLKDNVLPKDWLNIQINYNEDFDRKQIENISRKEFLKSSRRCAFTLNESQCRDGQLELITEYGINLTLTIVNFSVDITLTYRPEFQSIKSKRCFMFKVKAFPIDEHNEIMSVRESRIFFLELGVGCLDHFMMLPESSAGKIVLTVNVLYATPL